jgi:hypothetical protein
MADNTTLPGAGDVIASDDIGGAKYQRIKLIYGPDGTNSGDVSTANPLPVTEVKKITYRASTSAVLVAAVTATVPFLTIYGSATKTIRVQSIIISGLTLTAVAYLNIGLRKFSTAVSGGTSTALTKVALDSTNAASSATNVNAYTVAPTAGTTIGDIASRRIMGQATTAAAAGIPQVVDFDFSPTGDGTSPILRGTAEGLGLYWITAPATAVSMVARIEWTEE